MKLVYPPCPVANTRGDATEPLPLTSAPACQKDCKNLENGKKMAQMVSVRKITASIVVVDRKSQEKYWP
jgi:hypothetical protein